MWQGDSEQDTGFANLEHPQAMDDQCTLCSSIDERTRDASQLGQGHGFVGLVLDICDHLIAVLIANVAAKDQHSTTTGISEPTGTPGNIDRAGDQLGAKWRIGVAHL